jgi:hypothetical protein
LVITYKVGAPGDIPVTDVLIKDIGPMEHIPLTQEINGKEN